MTEIACDLIRVGVKFRSGMTGFVERSVVVVAGDVGQKLVVGPA